MDKKKIVQIIENFAPLELAEAWDCSGWLVETHKAEVKKVMLCLTVTDDIVRQAKSQNCDMLISHHPLFFVPFEYSGIDIYCAHTNLDRTQGGTTDKLIEVLSIPRPLKEKELCHCEERSDVAISSFVRYVDLEISTCDFAKKLCKVSKNVRLVNNKNATQLNKIAFCAGSGSEFIKEAISNGADCYVTGDLKFHTAAESDIVLFDIGHFESEYPVLEVFEKLLQKDVEIVFAEEKSPFEYCL